MPSFAVPKTSQRSGNTSGSIRGGVFLIAAYTPKQQRLDALARRIAEFSQSPSAGGAGSQGDGALERDEEETENPLGQQVKKTFWRGDAYVATTDQMGDAITRVIHLWFGHPFHTPTRDEYMMFCARAASYRSASMGRQVGAASPPKTGAFSPLARTKSPKPVVDNTGAMMNMMSVTTGAATTAATLCGAASSKIWSPFSENLVISPG